MKRSVLSFVIISIIISSCNTGAMWKDDSIDIEIREQIQELNSQIINGFITNNKESIYRICSDKLLEQAKSELDIIMRRVNRNLNHEDYRILNEFYQKNRSTNLQTIVMTGISEDNDYTIAYKALNKEMFVSVGYFNNDLIQICLTLIYGKYADHWKLNNIQFGNIKIMNKNAVDWYHVAQKDYEKGYLIDAMNDLSLSYQLLKPNQYWQYRKEKDIQDFGQKIRDEIKYSFNFPMVVDFVKTNPEIFSISTHGTQEGYYPLIQYTTSIDQSDTIMLKNECDAIHDKIGDLFYGLDKKNKIILYKAYESIPTGNNLVDSYGFIQKTRE